MRDLWVDMRENFPWKGVLYFIIGLFVLGVVTMFLNSGGVKPLSNPCPEGYYPQYYEWHDDASGGVIDYECVPYE